MYLKSSSNRNAFSFSVPSWKKGGEKAVLNQRTFLRRTPLLYDLSGQAVAALDKFRKVLTKGESLNIYVELYYPYLTNYKSHFSLRLSHPQIYPQTINSFTSFLSNYFFSLLNPAFSIPSIVFHFPPFTNFCRFPLSQSSRKFPFPISLININLKNKTKWKIFGEGI